MNLFDVKYFFKTQFLGYARELHLNAVALRQEKYSPKHKFVILSSGRSGSTLLTNVLNTSGNIKCYGEILRGKNIDPKKVVKLTEQACDKEAFGFKLLTYQLWDIQTSIKDKKAFLQSLVADGYKIIYLERSNSLLQALSVIYAMQRDVWHYRVESNIAHSKIILSPNTLNKTVQDFEEFKVQERSLLENLPYLYINYEQELGQPEKLINTVHKLSDYLQIPLQEPDIQLKKVTPKKLSGFIKNYREISNYILAQKRYAPFFDSVDSIF